MTRTAAASMSVEELAAQLRERILSGEAPTGTWLRQQRLAAEFGVSRTPVREALRSLQAQGIVEVLPRRGALVCGPTARDIREAYAVRAELEGYAAELAAQFARDEQVERLREADEMFRRFAQQETRGAGAAKRDGPRWSDANDLFHEVVLEAADNRRLAAIVRSLHDSFPRSVTWAALRGSSHLLRENAEQHRAVLDAIAAGDPRAAREAMMTHVRLSGELIARRFESQQS